jgi:hypothetical protein
MHIDQARFLEQLNTRGIKPARPRSPPLFPNPIAQTQVVAQASAERSLLHEPHPPLEPLLARLPRPSRERLQQRIELRIRPTTPATTMNPHPELETVITNIRCRHPRRMALSNICPQVRQRFIPERARRPDRPQIASERLPEHLMTARPPSQTRTQPQPQRNPSSHRYRRATGTPPCFASNLSRRRKRSSSTARSSTTPARFPGMLPIR